MNFVQAFITNISFPTSLDELYRYVHLFDIEKILGGDYFTFIDDDNYFDDSDPHIYESRVTSWTAPKWSKKGDIVFFMHSKTANTTISRLKTELINNRDSLSPDYFWTMMNSLFRAKKLHSVYGGKIFAIGKVSNSPEYCQPVSNDNLHWNGRIYAPIDSIFLLETPIDISEFNSKIMVSRQSSITSVSGDNFEYLKTIILKKNKVIESYFEDSVAEPMPLHNITEENWLAVVNKHRRSFFLEEQFRSYYVDRFLRYFGDTKSFYRECTCVKKGKAKTFVDNVVRFQGKFLLVEIKLSVASERNIIGQLSNYCDIDELWLDTNSRIYNGIYPSNVLVIDTEKGYMYSNKNSTMKHIFDLDDISTNEDIVKLRDIVADYIS